VSRIGKRPIPIPDKVSVTVQGRHVAVKGPKGELARQLPGGVVISHQDNVITVDRVDESRLARQRHGLCRTLVANMIEGVSNGYSKRLTIIGVGYRAQVQGQKLVLSLGYSHPVEMDPPPGIQFVVENNTNVIVSGIDKELVGDIAAKIRDARPPEPYKGKGVRYADEKVLRKAGKTGKK
jgi:large subunit ribosomal protein L6